MKEIIILGSTGSIGKQTLDIVKNYPKLTKEEIESLVTTGKIADNLEPLKEGETSLLKLREIAKAKKIKGYSKMTKDMI